jgi:hypothetical protein
VLLKRLSQLSPTLFVSILRHYFIPAAEGLWQSHVGY